MESRIDSTTRALANGYDVRIEPNLIYIGPDLASATPLCVVLARTQHQLTHRALDQRIHAYKLGKEEGVSTTQWTRTQPHGGRRQHCRLKHRAYLFQDQAIADIGITPLRTRVMCREDHEDLRWQLHAGSACGISKQSLEARSQFAYWGKPVRSRVVGVKASRNAEAAVHRHVSVQRIAGAAARVGTPARALVERAKQELRELARCERDGSLAPGGVPPLGNQRKWWILCEEPKQIGRLEGEAMRAMRCRARREPRSCFLSQMGLPQRDPCISGAGGRVEEQVMRRPFFVLDAVEELTPTHQRKDRQNRSLGKSGHRGYELNCRPPNRQVVQKRKQVAIVDRHSGPGARSLEGHYAPRGARERAGRKSQRPLGWAFLQAIGWWTQGDARREPAFRTAEGAREEPQPIKAKEQSGAAYLGVAIGGGRSKATLNLGLAAAASCKELEHLELAGRCLHPGLAGGGMEQRSSNGRADLHIRRERVGPEYGIQSHERIAKLVEGKG